MSDSRLKWFADGDSSDWVADTRLMELHVGYTADDGLGWWVTDMSGTVGGECGTVEEGKRLAEARARKILMAILTMLVDT